MSLINLESLSKRELLFHYVLNCQNRSLSLSYSDLEVLEIWLKDIHEDADALLLILSEILPSYYANKTKKVPLKRIQVSVSKKIKEYLFSIKTPSKVTQ